jgi:hypothetical protein
MKKPFRDSTFAHQILDGCIIGIEVGAAPHNPFNIKCESITYVDIVEKGSHKTGTNDIIAPGDNIPVPDKSYDFVLSSHVLEHFWNPIKAIKEWERIATKYIFMIVPDIALCYAPDTYKRTTLQELIDRDSGKIPMPDTYKPEKDNGHFSHWTKTDVVKLCQYMGYKKINFQHPDDKVGNGIAVAITLI